MTASVGSGSGEGRDSPRDFKEFLGALGYCGDWLGVIRHTSGLVGVKCKSDFDGFIERKCRMSKNKLTDKGDCK